MPLLDIAGSGLFHNSAGVLHALATILELAFGSAFILALTFFSFIGVIIYAVYRGYQTQSVLKGARTLIHAFGYAVGTSVALMFVLVAGLFFSIAVVKLLFITVLLGFAVSFVVRETFLFLVLKRFGKYLMYFTALQYLQEMVYPNGEQENQP